jgi:ABC-type multidrug transport system fused ATPase/permease subunit
MKEVYQKILVDYISKNKSIIAIYVLLVISYNIFSITALSKIKTKIISSFSLKHNNPKDIYNSPTFNFIKLFIFAYIIITLVIHLISYIEGIVYNDYISYLNDTIFENTIKSHSEYFEEIETSDHISRTIMLKSEMINLGENFLKRFSLNIFEIIIITGFVCYTNFKLGIILLVYIILSFLLSLYFGKEIIMDSEKKHQVLFDMMEKMSDSLHNLSHIYINNKNNEEIKEQENRSKEFKELSISLKNKCDYFNSINNIICISLVSILLFYLYKNFKNKLINKEDFILIFIVIAAFIASASNFTKVSTDMFLQLGLLESCNDFIVDLVKNSDKSDDTENISSSSILKYKHMINNGNIIFKNVSYKYIDENDQKEKYLFQNLNLEIKPREVTAIVGQSGSGKTTLCHLIMKLQKPQYGNIYIDNINYNDINSDILREKINYINQKTNLFNGTIMENIKYGNHEITDKQVIDFIKRNHLMNIFNEINGGIYGNCGVNGSNLSLGMQKTVIIMRGALKKNYCMIIFDEPLAGLDEKSREKIIGMIKKISNDKTVLIITHEKEIFKICDNVIDINNLKHNRLIY